MTAQIGNHFKFQGKKYNIVQMSQSIKFHPKQYGITPEPCCTGCWDGYWGHYDISEEGIFLEKLYVNSQDRHYPAINGIEKKDYTYLGHHVYEGLHIKCDYTGAIVIGRKFLPEFYVHAGFQRAWAYEEVIELMFSNGTLIKVVEHSEKVAKMREQIREDKNATDGRRIRIPFFIGESDTFQWDLDD